MYSNKKENNYTENDESTQNLQTSYDRDDNRKSSLLLNGSDSVLMEEEQVEDFINQIEHPQEMEKKKNQLLKIQTQRELDQTENKFLYYLKKREDQRNKEYNFDDIKLSNGNKDAGNLYKQEMAI